MADRPSLVPSWWSRTGVRCPSATTTTVALVARRGAGGLVSGIGPLMAGTDAIWVAAAMSDADREAAGDGVAEVEGFRFRALAVDPDTYRALLRRDRQHRPSGTSTTASATGPGGPCSTAGGARPGTPTAR